MYWISKIHLRKNKIHLASGMKFKGCFCTRECKMQMQTEGSDDINRNENR